MRACAFGTCFARNRVSSKTSARIQPRLLWTGRCERWWAKRAVLRRRWIARYVRSAGASVSWRGALKIVLGARTRSGWRERRGEVMAAGVDDRFSCRAGGELEVSATDGQTLGGPAGSAQRKSGRVVTDRWAESQQTAKQHQQVATKRQSLGSGRRVCSVRWCSATTVGFAASLPWTRSGQIKVQNRRGKVAARTFSLGLGGW